MLDVSEIQSGAEADAERLVRSTPQLPVGRYRFELQALDDIHLPGYAGSAWRGLIGHALKRSVCVTGLSRCERCLLRHGCVYSYLYETPPPPGGERLRRNNAVPHPYVLGPVGSPGFGVSAGQALTLDLTLFGRANAHVPYLLNAARLGGQQGLGSRRGQFHVADMQQETVAGSGCWQSILRDSQFLSPKPPASVDIPPVPRTTRIELQTPLRLRCKPETGQSHGEQPRLVSSHDFVFADLFRNLLRRISSLRYFHTPSPLDVDFSALVAEAEAFRMSAQDLRWYDWARYSARQRRKMKMGGLTGTLQLDGEGLAPFWPYLWLGQYTHAGKATTMGLGRYRIDSTDPASLPGRTVDERLSNTEASWD